MQTLFPSISTILGRLLDVPTTVLDPSLIYEHIPGETIPEAMMNVKVVYARTRKAAAANHGEVLARRMQHHPRVSLIERLRAELILRYASGGPGPDSEFSDEGSSATSTPKKPSAKPRRHVRGQPFIEPMTFEEPHEPFACDLPMIIAISMSASTNAEAECDDGSANVSCCKIVRDEEAVDDVERFGDVAEYVQLSGLCITGLERGDGNPFDGLGSLSEGIRPIGIQTGDSGEGRSLVVSESLKTPLDPSMIEASKAQPLEAAAATRDKKPEIKVKPRAILPATAFDVFFDSPSPQCSPASIDNKLELSNEALGKARPRLRRCQLVGSPSPRDGRLPIAIGARGEMGG